MRRDRSAVVETLFAALTSALLFSMFLVFPWYLWSALILAGVPAVRLTHARGAGYGAACAAATAAVLAGIGAADNGAGAAAGAALAGVLCFGLPVLGAALVRRGVGAAQAFLAVAVLGSAVVVGGIALSGGSPEKEIGALYDSIGSQPPQKGVDFDTAARMEFFKARAREFTLRQYSGIAAFAWVFLASIWFYAGAHAARPAPSAERIHYEELRLPAPAVALFVAAGAGYALLSGTAQTVAGDVLLPLVALYFLVGLSIICHFARRWFRSRILRAGLYFLVAYFPLCVGVGLLGLFDWYVDFRRRGEKA